MGVQNSQQNEVFSMRIIGKDRVKAITGHFEGQKGYVTRVQGSMACVVWVGGWEHGIWVNCSELKRTKRYKKDTL